MKRFSAAVSQPCLSLKRGKPWSSTSRRAPQCCRPVIHPQEIQVFPSPIILKVAANKSWLSAVPQGPSRCCCWVVFGRATLGQSGNWGGAGPLEEHGGRVSGGSGPGASVGHLGIVLLTGAKIGPPVSLTRAGGKDKGKDRPTNGNGAGENRLETPSNSRPPLPWTSSLTRRNNVLSNVLPNVMLEEIYETSCKTYPVK